MHGHTRDGSLRHQAQGAAAMMIDQAQSWRELMVVFPSMAGVPKSTAQAAAASAALDRVLEVVSDPTGAEVVAAFRADGDLGIWADSLEALLQN